MAEPFIGQINTNGFQFAPEHWSACEGQLLTINDHQAMFSLLGTAFGGDGRTNFALPDFRGTVAQGQGVRPGTTLELKMGQRRGAESTTLKDSNMVSHAHLASSSVSYTPTVELQATTDSGDSIVPGTGAYLATATPPGGGPDKPEQIYNSSPTSGSTVNLGGVSMGQFVPHGDVTVDANGSNQAFSIIQTGTVISMSIAMQGLFPSRN